MGITSQLERGSWICRAQPVLRVNECRSLATREGKQGACSVAASCKPPVGRCPVAFRRLRSYAFGRLHPPSLGRLHSPAVAFGRLRSPLVAFSRSSSVTFSGLRPPSVTFLCLGSVALGRLRSSPVGRLRSPSVPFGRIRLILSCHRSPSVFRSNMRMPGGEPGSQAWEACMMPLHYMRSDCLLLLPVLYISPN